MKHLRITSGWRSIFRVMRITSHNQRSGPVSLTAEHSSMFLVSLAVRLPWCPRSECVSHCCNVSCFIYFLVVVTFIPCFYTTLCISFLS